MFSLIKDIKLVLAIRKQTKASLESYIQELQERQDIEVAVERITARHLANIRFYKAELEKLGVNPETLTHKYFRK